MAEHDETVNFLLKKANVKEDKARPDSMNLVPNKDEKTKADSSAMVPLNPDEKPKPFVPDSPTEKFEKTEPDRGFQKKDVEAVEEYLKKQKELIK